ncbi:MAG: recombinase RecT [Patescibacteria group bacterium]|nr:recombinase RecT [Patescibacteria group bacterium]
MNESPSRLPATRGNQGVATQTTNPLSDLKALLEKYKQNIAMALPRHLTPERMIRVAITAVSQSPRLQECDLLTICGCVVQASQLGLDQSLDECFLVPFWNKKAKNGRGGYDCQLIVGYQGKIKLVSNTGELLGIKANVVRENDDFEFDDGIEPIVKHRYSHIKDRGKVIGYWAGVKLKSGFTSVSFMTVQEAEEHRDRFAMTRSKDGKVFGVWIDNPDAMALKTCIHKCLKYVPKSADQQTAWNLDERAEAGLPQKFSIDVPLELQPAGSADAEGEGEPLGLPDPSTEGGLKSASETIRETGIPTDAEPKQDAEPPKEAEKPKPEKIGLSLDDFNPAQIKAIEFVLRTKGLAKTRAQVEDWLSKWKSGESELLVWLKDSSKELNLGINFDGWAK